MTREAFDDETPAASQAPLQPRDLFDLDDDVPADELVHDEPRSNVGRWVALSVAVLVMLSVVGVSLNRSAQREHQRLAYDKLIALSTAGQQAVDSAVSQTRDVVQYAEPLLNTAQTSPATRTELLQQVSLAAQKSQDVIEAQRARLAAADAPGKLRAARDAAEKYLADWASVFSSAGGDGQPLDNVQSDLAQEQNAARAALRAAAPDKSRADEADSALGTDGW